MKTIRIDELIEPQETSLGREDKICRDIFWPGFVYDRGADAGGIYLFAEVMLEPLKPLTHQ